MDWAGRGPSLSNTEYVSLRIGPDDGADDSYDMFALNSWAISTALPPHFYQPPHLLFPNQMTSILRMRPTK